MPRFLYSVIFVALFFGGVIVHTLFTKSPQEQTNVLILIFALFVFLNALISLLLYLFSYRELTVEKEQRAAYRTAFKKALKVSFYVLVMLLLKYFQLLNLTTGGLFTIVYVFGNYLLRKSSR